MKKTIFRIIILLLLIVSTQTGIGYTTSKKKDITVEAGPFNAWEIESTFFDLFEYYYAPSVGNIIKIDATMPNGDINAELKSTNYS